MNAIPLYLPGTIYRKIFFLFDRFCDRMWDKRTTQSVILIMMSIILVEGVDSIRSQFFRFLVRNSTKNLNAYYHTLAHSTANYGYFLGVLVVIAISLIKDELRSAPVLIAIDDTTIEKFGKHFAGVGKLFDHSSHEKDKYVNGHCFVGACIKVPIPSGNGWKYLAVPIGYRMWMKESGKSKLDLAEALIREVMKKVGAERQLIVLCDAWYGKKQIFALASEYANLNVISNVRIDTALYELPPGVDPHKRGRRRKKGAKLSRDSFPNDTARIHDFYVRARRVKVNLISQDVWAFCSSTKEKGGSSRLFISTIDPLQLATMLKGYGKISQLANKSKWQQYSPMLLYFERWSIELTYFEHKSFWSLEDYMVRSEQGINMLLNLICVAYSVMKLLPYLDDDYSSYRDQSPQVLRLEISRQLEEEIIFGTLARKLTDGTKRHELTAMEKAVLDACQQYVA